MTPWYNNNNNWSQRSDHNGSWGCNNWSGDKSGWWSQQPPKLVNDKAWCTCQAQKCVQECRKHSRGFGATPLERWCARHA